MNYLLTWRLTQIPYSSLFSSQQTSIVYLNPTKSKRGGGIRLCFVPIHVVRMYLFGFHARGKRISSFFPFRDKHPIIELIASYFDLSRKTIDMIRVIFERCTSYMTPFLTKKSPGEQPLICIPTWRQRDINSVPLPWDNMICSIENRHNDIQVQIERNR